MQWGDYFLLGPYKDIVTVWNRNVDVYNTLENILPPIGKYVQTDKYYIVYNTVNVKKIERTKIGEKMVDSYQSGDYKFFDLGNIEDRYEEQTFFEPCPIRLDGKETTYCSFKIIRKRTTSNVISLSLWSGSDTYTNVLMKSIPFWWDVFPKIRKNLDWNIRLYIDDLSWKLLEKSFPKEIPEHIEIFLFRCPIAFPLDINMPTNQHQQTFGSLLRFHALTDKSLENVMVRNLEQFISPEDIKWMESRPESKKSQFWYYSYNPGHMLHSFSLYFKYSTLNPSWGTPSFGVPLAGVIWWKRNKNSQLPWSFDDIICESVNMTHKKTRFSYGVDEIVLFLLLNKTLKINPDMVSVTEYDCNIINIKNINDIDDIANIIHNSEIYKKFSKSVPIEEKISLYHFSSKEEIIDDLKLISRNEEKRLSLSMSFSEMKIMGWLGIYQIQKDLLKYYDIVKDGPPIINQILLSNSWKVKFVGEGIVQDFFRTEIWKDVLKTDE